MQKRTILSIIGFILLTAVVFIVFKKYLGDIEEFIRSSGVFGILLSLALYGLIAITPLPSDPVSILVIAIFRPLITFFVIWIGNTFIALIEYYIGHHLNKQINYTDKMKRLPFGLGNLPLESTKVLLIGRLVSGYGNKFISLLAGAHQVPLKRYLWTTAATNLLGALILTIGGHSFKIIVHFFIHALGD